MTYVRVDTKYEYIYLENDTEATRIKTIIEDDGTVTYKIVPDMRAQELLSDLWEYQRITKKLTIPVDKEPYVWYHKKRLSNPRNTSKWSKNIPLNRKDKTNEDYKNT